MLESLSTGWLLAIYLLDGEVEENLTLAHWLIQLILMIHRLRVCKPTYSLTVICNPKVNSPGSFPPIPRKIGVTQRAWFLLKWNQSTLCLLVSTLIP